MNRNVTPWIILFGHHPMYSSDASTDSGDLQQEIEPLLHTYNVDLCSTLFHPNTLFIFEKTLIVSMIMCWWWIFRTYAWIWKNLSCISRCTNSNPTSESNRTTNHCIFKSKRYHSFNNRYLRCDDWWTMGSASTRLVCFQVCVFSKIIRSISVCWLMVMIIIIIEREVWIWEIGDL